MTVHSDALATAAAEYDRISAALAASQADDAADALLISQLAAAKVDLEAEVARLQAIIDGPAEPDPDTAAPTVTITAPPSSVTEGAVTIRATITDVVGVASAVLRINGQVISAFARNGSEWTANGSFVPGTYTIQVDAQDAAGNSAAAQKSVTVNPVVVTPPPTGILGPDGSHEFSFAAPTATHVVAPTWSAISAQITACQSHPGVCAIELTPGTLPAGLGIGSSNPGVIQNIGSVAKTILIRPRDGFGTVKAASGTGVGFVGVKGLYFDRIDFSPATGVMIRNSESTGIGHTAVYKALATANGGTGLKNIVWMEVVFGPDLITGADFDRVHIATASSATIDGMQFIGCYAGSVWKPNGSSAHNDTLQLEQLSGGGTIKNVHFTDSVFFRSADQDVQTNALQGGVWKHSAFFGWAVTQLRYPLYSGGDPVSLDNTLNGTWVGITATDIICGGNISGYTFTSATNCRTTDSTPPAGWTVDSSLASMTVAQLNALAPYPTPARLASIW